MKKHLINAIDEYYATTICRPEDWKPINRNYHTHKDRLITCGLCKRIKGMN